jgi:predicted enzyme related to lactoylglutathione lyase
MPKTIIEVPGAPCWANLNSSDVARSADFYGTLFGWRIEQARPEQDGPDRQRPDHEGPDQDGYLVAFLGEDRVAGISPKDPADWSTDWWGVYLLSEDADATANAVRASGGRIAFGPDPVPGLGSFGGAVGPGGALIGFWQRAGRRNGIQRLEAPGAPSWFELYTRDYDADVDFYVRAFGWRTRVMSDTEDFRYTVQVAASDDLAGIWDAASFMPDGVASHWEVYFGARDVDDVAARAEALGGRVIEAPADSPYGRIATVADGTGAAFKVISVSG